MKSLTTSIACAIASLIIFSLASCGGGGGGGGGTAAVVPNPVTYTAGALAGEMLTYTVDMASLTYSYTITESQYGLTGRTGSGTLTNNGNGTYSVSGMSNAKVAILPNGILVGAIRETINNVLTTIPILGLLNPATDINSIAATYNFVQRSCLNGVCASGYGTFQILANGTWTSCPSGNLTTGCGGVTNTGTVNSLGGGKWQVMQGATNIGTAIIVNSAGQSVVILDLKDTRGGGFGVGLIVGSSQQAVTTAQTNGTWVAATTTGHHATFTTSGSQVSYTTVDGVASNQTTSFTANSPWAGFATTASGGHALLAGTGVYAEQNSGGYAEIGIKIN